MTIAALVLAAGRSSRFEGGNKLTLPISGDPLVRHVLNEVSKAPVSEVILVAAPGDADVIRAAGEGSWRIAINREAETGIASSIRCGISELAADVDGALIVLADMPAMTAPLITKIIAAFRADGQRRITFPLGAGGRQGHPVLWPKSSFADLLQLNGDKGGKQLIAAAGASVLSVPVDDDAAFIDIDTPADLAAFRNTRL